MPAVNCLYTPIQYGNFVFSAYTVSTFSKQNVFAEDDITLKYVRHTLEVEFIIAKGMYSTAAHVVSNSIDETLDAIYKELTLPRRQLVFSYHSNGSQMNVVGNAAVPSATNAVHVEGNIFEGPFPEIVNWEPMGMDAAKCRWRVNFNLLSNSTPESCNSVSANTIKNLSRQEAGRARTIEEIIDTYVNSLYSAVGSPLAATVLSIVEEQEVSIDEDGYVEMSLIGTIELTGSGHNFLNASGAASSVPRLIQMLTHYFEPLHPPGFTRTQKYKYKKSKREIEYIITDRELKTDNPIFPSIVNIDVTHSVSSKLLGDDIFDGAGFLTWNNTFDGTIKVAPGVWKGVAWLAMMTVVNQRMNRTAQLTGEVPVKVKEEVDGVVLADNQEAQKRALKEIKPRHICHSITITEKVFSNEVTFNLSYMVISPLKTLFDKTGLFYSTHIAWQGYTYPDQYGVIPTINDSAFFMPWPYENQWNASNTSRTRTQNVFGYRGPLLPGYNAIFDPYVCEDPNRAYLGEQLRNPEQENGIQLPSGGTVNAGTFNINNLAQHRRNANVNIFQDLDFWENNTLPAERINVKPEEQVPGQSPGMKQDFTPTPNQYPGSDANLGAWMRSGDPASTWIAYQPHFEIIREQNSVMFPSISSESVENRYNPNPRGPSTIRSYKGFNIEGSEVPYPEINAYEYDDPQVFGKTMTYIRFSGRALRAGYPIPTPSLVGLKPMDDMIDGDTNAHLVKAYLVGEAKWSHNAVNASADIPVFMATWDMVYALKGDPSCSKIGFHTASHAEYL
jgi:hypothetical protein